MVNKKEWNEESAVLVDENPREAQPERVELRDLLEELAMEHDPHLLRLWLEQQEQAERDQSVPEKRKQSK